MHQGLTIPAESSLGEASRSICWGLMAESLLLLTSRGVSRAKDRRHHNVKYVAETFLIKPTIEDECIWMLINVLTLGESLHLQ